MSLLSFSSPRFVFARLHLLSLLVLLGLFTTGCFDLEEEITLRADGSGTYTNRIDMSQMMAMLSGFGGDESSGDEVFDNMDSSMQVMADRLRELDGISNVAHRSEGYVFSVSYEFADIDALNLASQNSQLDSESSAPGMPDLNGAESNYSFANRIFSRADAPIDAGLSELDDEDEAQMQMVRMMMGDASYRAIYHLPGKVKRMSNDAASLSDDGKTVSLDISFLDLMEGKANIGNDIRLK